MKLVLDMETRSRTDLLKCGMYAYAEGDDTDILCIAAKPDSQDPVLWIPQPHRHMLKGNDGVFIDGSLVFQDPEFMNIIARADQIIAHNSGFERAMWNELMIKKYNFPEIPFDKWRCTAAKSAAFALPRSLFGVTQALGLEHEKDKTGYKIMLKMSKPKKDGSWSEDPDDFLLLCKYCIDDVEAEYELDQALPDLSEDELGVWKLDQRINDRGVAVDIDAVDNLIYKVEEKKRQLLLEVGQVTAGRIKSTTQRDLTMLWLKERGVDLPNLQKETVIDILDTKLPADCRRLLEIRQSLAKSSVSKLQAMKRRASKDNRMRGTLLYHGASTGRWAGQGIQPHNYPRNSYEAEDIRNILLMGVQEVEDTYGCTIKEASKCLRGMLISTPGKHLYCADYSSIEARVIAWIANEPKILEAFRAGLDLYKVTASQIYHKPYEQITSKERQVGKTAVLALGYQGWLGAFQDMAKTYGVSIEDELAKNIIINWREANPNIVQLWRGVETAAMSAVKTGKAYSYGVVKYGMRDNFLHCRLPSGRLLAYCEPVPKMITTKYGQKKEVISFMGVNSYTKKWERLTTYGGKLTENIVQAVARDILVEHMIQMDMLDYDTVLHVHDEIVVEAEHEEVKEIEEIMSIAPVWAKGCPMGAEGWAGDRYRKA